MTEIEEKRETKNERLEKRIVMRKKKMQDQPLSQLGLKANGEGSQHRQRIPRVIGSKLMKPFSHSYMTK